MKLFTAQHWRPLVPSCSLPFVVVLLQMQNPRNDADNGDEKEDDDDNDTNADNDDDYQYNGRKDVDQHANAGGLTA